MRDIKDIRAELMACDEEIAKRKETMTITKKEGIKGCIAPGADADLIVYGDGMIIEDVYAKGRLMVKAGEPVVKGYFEE